MPADTDLVVDLVFGDNGKGATVASRSNRRKPSLVFRWNGGHQAAHNVISPTGEHHCFSGFGSHTLNHPDVPTYLGPKFLFDPYMALREHERLKGRGRLLVDVRAVVVTPWHVAMNQLRETVRSGSRHGSCGMGIGEVRADELAGRLTIRTCDLVMPEARDLWVAVATAKRAEAATLLAQSSLAVGDLPEMARLLFLPETSLDQVWENWFREVLTGRERTWRESDPSVFAGSEYVIGEGAQGLLLDEWVGFNPYTTWTDCTPTPAISLLREAGVAPRPKLVGVIRAHGCRHGAGPFPGELNEGIAKLLVGEHNNTGPWQGKFRVGLVDLPLLRYAHKAVGDLDELYVRHLDRLPLEHLSYIEGYADGAEAFFTPPSRSLSTQAALAASVEMAEALTWVRPVVREAPTLQDLVQEIRAAARCSEGTDCYGPQ